MRLHTECDICYNQQYQETSGKVCGVDWKTLRIVRKMMLAV